MNCAAYFLFVRLSFDGRNADKQRKSFAAFVFDSMRNSRWSNYKHARGGCACLRSDVKTAASAQDKIKFVGVVMRVNTLCLTRFQAIQSDHDMCALPERCFEEFLRLSALEVLPVKKVVHCCSSFRKYLSIKLTYGCATMKRACGLILCVSIVRCRHNVSYQLFNTSGDCPLS